jgi:hypothetical protein
MSTIIDKKTSDEIAERMARRGVITEMTVASAPLLAKSRGLEFTALEWRIFLRCIDAAILSAIPERMRREYFTCIESAS